MWLNLASAGFVNRRPVRRLAAFSWLLALAALAANLWLYSSYYIGSGESGARLAVADQRLAEERAEISRLEARIAGMDLARQNATVAYLNRKIEDRTFTWSVLLDRVAEILPDQVRVTSLGQERGKKDEDERKVQAGNEVRLRLTGEAKTDEGLLAFVDGLYASPSFGRPNLVRERQNENGYLIFEVTVTYRPAAGGERTEPATSPSASMPTTPVTEPDGGEK